MSIVLREYTSRSRAALRNTLLGLLPKQGSYPSGIPGVSLHRFAHNWPPKPLIYTPILVVIVQGVNAQGKEWGKTEADESAYGDLGCFVAGIGMPVFCCVKEASPENPHLALTMKLDHGLLTRLTQLDHCKPGHGGLSLPGAQIRHIDDHFSDACLRLVKLLTRPEQIPFLAPLFRAELHYRLLLGPFGGQLRSLCAAGARQNRVTEAVNWLRRNHRLRLHVETLAGRVDMAISTLRENFKETLRTKNLCSLPGEANSGKENIFIL